MITKLKFSHKYNSIDYIVKNISDDEVKLPFIPNKSNDYDGYISINNKDFIKIPMEILIGNRGFDSKERDNYSDILDEIEDYFDEDIINVNSEPIIKYNEELDTTLKIYDLTEEEINGYEKLDMSSKPIWLFNGIRKYIFKMDEKEKNIFKSIKSMTFKMKNINNTDKKKIGYECPIDILTSIFFLDTDEIGRLAEIVDPEGVYTKTYIEIQLKGVTISYPIDLRIIDLSFNSDIHKTEEVAIDFGTSSTCIAYSDNKMLHFSDRVEKGSEEEYENITSFFIYNWNKMEKIWNDTGNHPQLSKLKTKKNEELAANLEEHFGDGRNVQDLMSKLKKEKLAASIFEIKNLATLKRNTKFRQYHNYIKSPDLELGFNKEAVLNPIELYAYLIGRKLNSPIKGNVYTRYHLTTPVKYSVEAKERIRKSFELGLARSLPNNLKKEIKVRTTYDEPTALLGSLLGDHFLNQEQKPKFFSIFDFGGGTLDYIFGVYRTPLDEGKVYLAEKEEEEYEHVIEILNSGGSNECGGEKILKRMAYQIYLQNVELLGKKVPILVPEGEERSDQVNSSLYGNDVINRINLEVLVETFARKILYGISLAQDKQKSKWTSTLNLEESKTSSKSAFEDDELSDILIEGKRNKSGVILQTKDSKEEMFDLEINIDEILNMYIKIIEDNIDGFIKDLKDVSEIDRVKEIGKEYKADQIDIYSFDIFLAGNSCKSPVVQQILSKKLPHTEIVSLGEAKNNKNKYNLKTVVAKGYKKLNGDILIHNWKKEINNKVKEEVNSHLEPLKYRVVNFNLDEIIDIVPKNSHYSKDFKRFGGLESEKNTFNLYYTESSKKMTREDIGKEIKIKSIVIPEDIMEKYVNNRGKVHVYIEAYGHDKIIYTFGKKKGIFEEILDNIEEFKEKCVISL